MRAWSRGTDPRPRCPTCGKAVFTSWLEARRAANGQMRTRPGMRGIRPYWSKRCQVFHVYTATNRRNEKIDRQAKDMTDTRLEYQKIHDRSISEQALQNSMIEVAEVHGWTVHHETDSRRSNPGLPDLICAHPVHGVVFVELKSERGYLKPAQKEWRDVLIAGGSRYYVFRPRDRFIADGMFTRGEWPEMEEYQK